MDISENEKVGFLLRSPGIEPPTSETECSERAKSSSDHDGVRTRDLAHDGIDRNHQTSEH